MKLQSIALVTLALLTTGLTVYFATRNSDSDKKYFKEYVEFRQKFKKLSSSPTELEYRYKVFESNMKMIDEKNAQNLSYKLGMNQFTDLTWEEFKAKYLSPITIQNKAPKYSEVFVTGNVDWRTKGNVSKVKNQEQCGSCWAFSTTGALESAYSIFKNQNIELSEQELVDCATSYGNNGCNGGLMNLAFDYIKDKEITDETSYPYKGLDGRCKSKTTKTRYSIKSYEYINPVDVNGLMKALDQQPVSVAIEVQHDFMHYTSGVYKNNNCGDALNHGVLAVGYNSEDTDGYFIVKNSWDVYWGDKGYVKMAIGTAGGRGTCGIANESDVYPILN
jgi:C1A family cysteine protease